MTKSEITLSSLRQQNLLKKKAAPPSGTDLPPGAGSSSPRRELFDLSVETAPEQEEGWLISYLDVLTLLISFFVLLIVLSGLGRGQSEDSPLTDERPGLNPLNAGLLPENSGIQPRFDGLAIEGVSVIQQPEGVILRIEDRLLFDSGQAALRDDGREMLSELANLLTQIEGEISIEGHTDDRPISTARFPSNWELSTARASAVLRVLTDKGFAPERLRAIGYADTRPIADNDTEDGRQSNRRVELLVHSNGG